MKTNVNYKILAMVPVFGCALNSCKQNPCYHKNTVVSVGDKEILVKDVKDNQERLICATDRSISTLSLLEDLPYFHEGDTVTIYAINYDNIRVLETVASDRRNAMNIFYNQDTIEKRKDIEQIERFKQRQQHKVR